MLPVSTRGYLICVIATFMMSLTGIFISYLSQTYHLPALVLAFWRVLFGVVALFVFFSIFKPSRLNVQKRHMRFLLLYGLEISVFNSLWTISVAMNGAAIATVLAYSSVAFTTFLGKLLFGERLDALKVTAVVLSLLGCVFVSGAYTSSNWQVNPIGVTTGLISGLAYAGYILMGKSASRRGINPWTTLLYTFGFAIPFLLFYNLIHHWLPSGVASINLFWLGGSLAGWSTLAFLGMVLTIGGFGLYMVSLRDLPASVANLIATLEPVMTATWAFLLLGERFNQAQWLGSGMVIAGVMLVRMSETRNLRR